MAAQFRVTFALVIFSPLVIVFADLGNSDATASSPWLNPAIDSKYTRTPLADVPTSSSRLGDEFTLRSALPHDTELTSEPKLQGENLRLFDKPASPNTTVIPSRNGRLSKQNLQKESKLQTIDRLTDKTSSGKRGLSRGMDMLPRASDVLGAGPLQQSDVSARSDGSERKIMDVKTDPILRLVSLRKTGPVHNKRSLSNLNKPTTFKALCSYEKVINNDLDKSSKCTRECVNLSAAIEDIYENNSYIDGIKDLFDDCAGFTRGSCSKIIRTAGKKYAVCNCIGWIDGENFKTEYAYYCRTRLRTLKTANNLDVAAESNVKNSVQNQLERKQKSSNGVEIEP